MPCRVSTPGTRPWNKLRKFDHRISCKNGLLKMVVQDARPSEAIGIEERNGGAILLPFRVDVFPEVADACEREGYFDLQFWSSSVDAGDSDCPWLVMFFPGRSLCGATPGNSVNLKVRLVRDRTACDCSMTK